MKASEIIRHALSLWRRRATNASHMAAISAIELGLSKLVEYVGDVDLQVQWKPPSSASTLPPAGDSGTDSQQ